jgi:diguanylate cyclase (GGDEF)-like protein
MTVSTPLPGLVVEDDEAVRTLVEHALSSSGIELRAAAGIAEAWRHLEVEDFSVVILDLVLPDGDGRRFLSELRAWPRTARVPVVVLSAKGSRAVQLDCFQLGADEFFEKPFDPAVLGAAVLRQIERARVVASGDRLDPVTRLPNREALATRFREIAAFAHARSQPATVAYLTLDEMADAKGASRQSATDTVLQEVARILHRTLRSTDSYGRWNERGLVLLFPGTRTGPARQVVERLSRQVRSRGIPLPPPRGSAETAGTTEARVSFSAALGDALGWSALEDAVGALAHLLQRTVGEGPARIVMDQDPSEAEASRVRILLVDDDPGVATLVRYRLEREGIDVQHVSDGTVALALVQDAGALGEFDLVVLDVKLPGAGGYELLEVLRKSSPLRRVPVVMLTQMGREADVVRAFELGADDYVLKPFSPIELMARIRRLLRVA